MMAMDSSGAAQRWGLYAGVALGLILALLGLKPGTVELPAEAVANVNGVLITHAQWQLALDAVAADRDTPLTVQDRERVLNRLVDEELLMQYAVELDLIRGVPGVRAALVGAVVQSQVADADTQTPAPEVLRAFYAANQGYFARQPALRISGWRFPDHTTATQAAAALRAGAAAVGGEPMPLPESPLDAGARRTYLGATLAAVAEALPAGAVSNPQPLGRAWYVLRIDGRSDGELPAFEAVREQVLAEWRRREAESRVQAMLAQLRADGEVRVRDPQ